MQYAYGFGSHGCVFDYNSLEDNVSFDTEREAKKALIDHLGKDELTKQAIYKILRYGSCDLDFMFEFDDHGDRVVYPLEHSLKYCEVFEVIE